MDPLEYLAKFYDNEVRYDADGNPSVFVKFPKMKSVDLHSSLPNHTHPAFIINGQEQDYILIGKYGGSCLDGQNGRVQSAAGAVPLYGKTADEMLMQCRQNGSGWSGVTIADRGFLLLLAQKLGWTEHGNNSYGSCSEDAEAFAAGASVTAGARRAYRGILWECIASHTTSAALAPDKAPKYWKMVRRIGGAEASTEASGDIGLTMTGSGALDWYLGGNAGSVCDLCGNQEEADYGYRVVNGEIQILPNNDAAAFDADLSSGSAAWKAILPNAGDDGYTLAAPGTAGTLHWSNSGANVILDNHTQSLSSQVSYASTFRNLTAGTAVKYVPSILKELGLFPVADSTANGEITMRIMTGECLQWRGGSWKSGAQMGMGCMDTAFGRTKSGMEYGCRVRCMDAF